MQPKAHENSPFHPAGGAYGNQPRSPCSSGITAPQTAIGAKRGEPMRTGIAGRPLPVGRRLGRRLRPKRALWDAAR